MKNISCKNKIRELKIKIRDLGKGKNRGSSSVVKGRMLVPAANFVSSLSLGRRFAAVPAWHGLEIILLEPHWSVSEPIPRPGRGVGNHRQVALLLPSAVIRHTRPESLIGILEIHRPARVAAAITMRARKITHSKDETAPSKEEEEICYVKFRGGWVYK